MHKENLLLPEKSLTEFMPMIKFLLSSKNGKTFWKTSIHHKELTDRGMCSTFSCKIMIAFKMYLF